MRDDKLCVFDRDGTIAFSVLCSFALGYVFGSLCRFTLQAALIIWRAVKRAEVAVFAVSMAYFTALCAPALTWINTDSDGSVYLRAAKYLVISHPWGAPLFNLFNAGVVRVPVGDEAWRLAMVSVICSAVTATLLYVIARRWVNPWLALVAPIVWMASPLVVSQSTIIETYSPVVLLMVLVYYFHITDHPRAKYIMGALGLGLHHLIMFALLVVFLHDIRRYGWRVTTKRASLVLLGILPYAYVFFANRAPYYWIEGQQAVHYLNYFTSQTGLIGGLALFDNVNWRFEPDLLLRLQDLALVSVGFGASLLFILPALTKRENAPLSFLFGLPLLYYLTDLAPQTYVYAMPAFAFGSLLAVRGVQWWATRVPLRVAHYAPHFLILTSLVLIGFNIQYMDIGRTLDREMQAEAFYHSLEELPQDSTVWIEHGGWWRATVWLYDSEQGAEITALPVFGHGKEWNLETSLDAALADELWRLEITEPTIHGSRIVKATMADLPILWESAEGVIDMPEGSQTPLQSGWVNPYMLVSGQKEIERWGLATKSNINAAIVLTFAFAGIVGSAGVGYLRKKRFTRWPKWTEWFGWAVGLAVVFVILSIELEGTL